MKDNNVGQEGYESLRINGSKIGNLPLGQGEKARQGLAEFIKTEKQTKVNNIKAKYPNVSEAYIEAALKELKNNISRVKQMKNGMKDKIAEYSTLVTQSQVRDAQTAQLSKDNPAEAKQIKELLKKYPPYNVKALQDQIEQFEQSIDRCNSVLEREYESIAEFRGTLALIKQREIELRNIK
ncbi:hypothetical protein N9045_00925 [bacterium]|nr:hypothetical protein [bacterium]